MSDIENDSEKKYEEQTEDLYAAFGKFAVEFEHICNYLRAITKTILAREGLQNERVMHVILAALTAEPLRTLVQSLIHETLTLSDTDKKIVRKLLNRMQELTKTRNEVLHGTWFIGWAGVDDDFSNAPGIKIKSNKEGAVVKSFNWNVADFEELTSEVIQLANLFGRLNGCIAEDSKIESNFVINPDGTCSSVPHRFRTGESHD